MLTAFACLVVSEFLRANWIKLKNPPMAGDWIGTATTCANVVFVFNRI